MSLRPEVLGRYRIDRELGRGGMGVVYLAHDPGLGRYVAIKTLPPGWTEEARLRFEREARTLAGLNHPNVATVHELGEVGGSHFLVMEHIEGETLRELMDRERVELAEAIRIAVEIAQGLGAAHERNIVHRDLKPGNVMRRTDGRIKILDFGLAKSVAIEQTLARSADITEGLRQLGTASYMSPEQLRGEDVDARSDVFAFGVVLYELLTGERPFGGETKADLASAVLRDAAPVPSRVDARVPPALDRVVGKCLAKSRAERYPSAAELLAELRAFPQEATTAERAPSIAVLPFANLSADPDNELFADGLAEEILNSLGKLESLRVAARTSSFAFRGRNEDVRRIGRELGVTTVLEGSVRRAGPRLRVSAQLLGVDDGYQLWSERFDRSLDDVFAVQDEIATSIARALKVVLSDRDRKAMAAVPSRDVRAYELYLRGTQLTHRATAHGFERAKHVFRRAVEFDSQYAPAHAGLAMAAAFEYLWVGHDPAVLEEAERASRAALELDPNLATAHVAQGLGRSLRGDFATARSSFDRALELDPRSWDALYFYGRTCFGEGEMQAAASLFQRAAAVRPDDYQAPSLLALCYKAMGRSEEQHRQERENVLIIERHLERQPDDVRAIYLGANALGQLGQRERALEWADRALALDPHELGVRYNVACVYVNQGRIDEGLDLLEGNVDRGWGYGDWIANDPDFAGLRDHPRFRVILAKIVARDA